MLDYENNKTDPGLELLQRIADALKVPVTKLYDDYYTFLSYPYSKKLKELRAEHGLTQGELGKMLGIVAKSVARWEQGRAVVTRKQWEKLHQLFSTV